MNSVNVRSCGSLSGESAAAGPLTISVIVTVDTRIRISPASPRSSNLRTWSARSASPSSSAIHAVVSMTASDRRSGIADPPDPLDGAETAGQVRHQTSQVGRAGPGDTPFEDVDRSNLDDTHGMAEPIERDAAMNPDTF